MAIYLKKIEANLKIFAHFIFKTFFIRCTCPGRARNARNNFYRSLLDEKVRVNSLPFDKAVRVYKKDKRRLNCIVFDLFENPIFKSHPSICIYFQETSSLNKQIN